MNNSPVQRGTGEVVWQVTMSADGFISGPDDNMDWVFGFTEPNTVVDEVIATTGAVLAGRNSYEVGHRDDQPAQAREVHGGRWAGPQFVLTHRPVENDSTISILSGDIRAAVEVARAAAGDNNVLIIGADVARQAVLAGLVDEIVMHLAPVLLGSGTRLFASAVPEPVTLHPAHRSTAGQITNLRYRLSSHH